MNDQEYLHQFEQCILPKELFKHRGHVRICYLYLKQFPLDEANKKICDGIKKYAASLDALQIYHETMTQAWINIVASAIDYKSDDFENFIAKHPDLLNSKLIHIYYSPEILNSDRAKQEYVKPDLKSL
ncbi:MAG TPA: hypothetical protein VL360_00935 [Gammaproteobacteria bacterium]|jgi:hypothetical protein|nr:hypothetical protein [Gammaproteobacteria bacterium]